MIQFFDTYRDFHHNFSAVENSNDETLKKDFILQEISKIIVFQREEFIDALRLSGFEVPDDITDEEIADIVVKNAGTSEKLRRGISFLIFQHNAEDEGKSNLVNGDGKVDVGGILSGLGNAVGSIFDYSTAKQNKEAAEQSAKYQLLEQMVALRASQNQKKGISTGAVIAIVAGVLAIAGVVIFIATRPKKVVAAPAAEPVPAPAPTV